MEANKGISPPESWRFKVLYMGWLAGFRVAMNVLD